ncbi:HoxN/HupN/NixA family nickel/cobalt transporter [Streptomyces beijiangensis]|uniref:Nickel transporter n=1 Tax=Streptomyces beijiangensis TaxID=163361 RepID=A0A939FB56_9ACTN|nr:nickel transporter [Streptomyces beijiangensis]MBO0516021.1 nickel transporter [Streptomyces beijiangensis]
MTRRLTPRSALAALAVLPFLLTWNASSASAHPLGNFTVNRYDGLTLTPDRLEDFAVLDTAEIPTLQAMPDLDTDHNGLLSTAEKSAHANAACASLAHRVTATIRHRGAGNRTLNFRVSTSSYRLVAGQAGLDTGRLECRLTADLDTAEATAVTVHSGVDTSRIGWHEITATAAGGAHIGTSDVPSRSLSNALHRYPAGLLSNPPDTRHARLVMGKGTSAPAAAFTPASGPSSWYTALEQRLGALSDQNQLTLPVGLLAIALALLLGSGHALLPGHGKTIMAAYLAGRQGRPRDAVTVASTVTLTHTASVLLLGIALSISSALVGEQALAWLATASGLLIMGAGAWLLPQALRTLRQRPYPNHSRHLPAQGSTAPTPDPSHSITRRHGEHRHSLAGDRTSTTPSATPTGEVRTGQVLVDSGEPASRHDHEESHTHAPHQHHHEHGHAHGLLGHHHHGHRPAGGRKAGLIGIGIAGGLVPSPSALVVLLGSIALGRTIFGITLVICYGLGMALTLTAAGLLLLTLRNRLPALNGHRASSLTAWAGRITPLGTALLILAVGAGTLLRALPA